MNQFVWDMTYDGAEELDGMILWWASLDGPQAIPGVYKVNLKVDDEVKSQTFTRQSFPTTNRALTTTYNSSQDSTGSSF